MRALTSEEHDALTSAADVFVCGTEPAVEGRRGEMLDASICRRLVQRGLAVCEPCHTCQSNHLTITTTGRVALRIDAIARSLTA